jgi:hypothetical protein
MAHIHAMSAQSNTMTEVVPRCPCNGQPMNLVRSYPGIGALPELHTFRCERCGHVETVEVK